MHRPMDPVVSCSIGLGMLWECLWELLSPFVCQTGIFQAMRFLHVMNWIIHLTSLWKGNKNMNMTLHTSDTTHTHTPCLLKFVHILWRVFTRRPTQLWTGDSHMFGLRFVRELDNELELTINVLWFVSLVIGDDDNRVTGCSQYTVYSCNAGWDRETADVSSQHRSFPLNQRTRVGGVGFSRHRQ